MYSFTRLISCLPTHQSFSCLVTSTLLFSLAQVNFKHPFVTPRSTPTPTLTTSLVPVTSPCFFFSFHLCFLLYFVFFFLLFFSSFLLFLNNITHTPPPPLFQSQCRSLKGMDRRLILTEREGRKGGDGPSILDPLGMPMTMPMLMPICMAMLMPICIPMTMPIYMPILMPMTMPKFMIMSVLKL